MYARTIGTLILLLVSFCGCNPSTYQPPTFDAQASVDAWVDLWGSYDLDRLEDLFLADARLTYLSSEREGLIQGFDELRAHHEGFGFVSGGKAPTQELWVEEVNSSLYGSTAVLTARWLFGDRTALRDSISQGPMTVVYVLDGDTYRIAHMHFANY